MYDITGFNLVLKPFKAHRSFILQVNNKFPFTIGNVFLFLASDSLKENPSYWHLCCCKWPHPFFSRLSSIPLCFPSSLHFFPLVYFGLLSVLAVVNSAAGEEDWEFGII